MKRKFANFWRTTVYYTIHNNQPLDHILCHMNTVQFHPNYIFKIHFNIILPSTPSSSHWFLFFLLPHQNPLYNPLLPTYATCPTHLLILGPIILLMFGGEQKTPNSSLRSFIQSSKTFSLLRPIIFISAPLSKSEHASMFFPHCKIPLFTPIQNKRQTYSHAHFHFLIRSYQTRRRKIPDGMTVCIPRRRLVSTLFMYSYNKIDHQIKYIVARYVIEVRKHADSN